jgi:hypothetical protein
MSDADELDSPECNSGACHLAVPPVADPLEDAAKEARRRAELEIVERPKSPMHARCEDVIRIFA